MNGALWMKTLRDIETDVAALARRIDALDRNLPTYGVSEDFARPHIEVEHGFYHYVIVARGVEIDRRFSDNYDDLLYWIFREVARNLAFSYELKNRIEDQDCRRIAFPKQLELMTQLDKEMGERLEGELAEILRLAPYDDEPIKAANRMRRKS